MQLPNEPVSRRIYTLLTAVSRETQLLQHATMFPAVDALLASLPQNDMPLSTASTYDFLDNAITRFIRRPVYYEDMIDSLVKKEPAMDKSRALGPVSRLLVALVEQWPHLARLESLQESEKLAAATTLARFLACCSRIGEDSRFMLRFQRLLVDTTLDVDCQDCFNRALDLRDSLLGSRLVEQLGLEGDGDILHPIHPVSPPAAEVAHDADEIDSPMLVPNAKSIFRWLKKDLEEAVEEGDLSDLVMCLCSDELSTRVQALSGLSKFVARLEASTYVEREVLALLLQETIHTAKKIVPLRPFPTYLGAFASRAVLIETDPQHVLYGKLNKFLLEAPMWNPEKVPMTRSILLAPPDVDDATVTELEWLLEIIHDGLRTPEVRFSRRTFSNWLFG